MIMQSSCIIVMVKPAIKKVKINVFNVVKIIKIKE